MVVESIRTMRYNNPKLREMLAAEYVLGTLHGAARRRFERLLQSDAELQELVYTWEQSLNSLADTLSPREPPPTVWEAVRRRLNLP